MNVGETVEDLIGEVFDVLVGERLSRVEDALEIRVHEVEDDVDIGSVRRAEKDIANADDVLVIDEMPEDFDLAVRSHADEKVLDGAGDLLDRHVRRRLTMACETHDTVRAIA